jgi:protein phosphatase 1G
MGAYLSEPNTQKESQDDSSGLLSYGASSMQGWRMDQEDAHSSLLNFDSRTQSALFAVYDGHGGSEVAQYCAKYLPNYLKEHIEEFKPGGDMHEALRQLFLRFDEKLKSDEAQKELNEMKEKASDDEEEDGENETTKVNDEAVAEQEEVYLY